MARYFTRSIVRLAVACVLALFLFLGVFVHFSPQAHAAAGKPFVSDNYFTASLSGNIKGCSSSQEWIFNIDQNGYFEDHTRSNGGQLCAQAVWNIGSLTNCTWYLFVPSSYADITNIGIGFTYWSGFTYTHKVFSFNENIYTDTWGIIPTGNLQAVLTVDLSNNDGYPGPDPYIGISTGSSLEAVCP